MASDPPLPPKGLGLGFHVLLRGTDAPVVSQRVQHPAKVVLLHGWLQSHDSWLSTGRRLRDTYGHDVLLFDCHGHGRSPPPSDYRHLSVDAYCDQCRQLVVHYWGAEAKVTLAGCSAGGGAACLYSVKYPACVERIILVASAGLSEPAWWNACHSGAANHHYLQPLLAALANSAVGGAVMRRFPLNYFFSHLHFVRNTPQYGLPPDLPKHLRQFPLTLIWGKYDLLHTPQIRRWKDGRKDVNVMIVPLAGHVRVCLGLDRLNLHAYPQFWHGTESSAPASSAPASSAPASSAPASSAPASGPPGSTPLPPSQSEAASESPLSGTTAAVQASASAGAATAEHPSGAPPAPSIQARL